MGLQNQVHICKFRARYKCHEHNFHYKLASICHRYGLRRILCSIQLLVVVLLKFEYDIRFET